MTNANTEGPDYDLLHLMETAIGRSLSLDEGRLLSEPAIKALAKRLLQIDEALQDTRFVHLNILNGSIAKPTPAQIGHLYRDAEARDVVAELTRQNPEAFKSGHKVSPELMEKFRDAVQRIGWEDVAKLKGVT